MISITEILLIVAGFGAIIAGYLIPAGKNADEEQKRLIEEEVDKSIRRAIDNSRNKIEDMVDDTMEDSINKAERAIERLTNEKISAISEYSDTVINDIHKNHDEVMFMYDMLNDKHKNLTNVVTEVTRKADEAKQVVRDAEATAREAQVASSNLKASTPDNVRAILLDEEEDTLSGIKIPVKAKEPSAAPVEPVSMPETPKAQEPVRVVKPEPVVPQSGYVDERHLEELDILEDIPAEVLSSEQISNLHVIGGKDREENNSKVVKITEAVRVEGRSKNPDKNMKELTANDPVSQNKQIIEMHKAGKSNMVIARELGLGIGEVKLVIDLSNKHRKVR